MSISAQRTIVGSFPEYDQAQRCVGALEQAGFGENEVGVLRKDETDGKHAEGSTGTHVHPAVGLGTGAVEGGLIGAAAAFLIPGAGPVIGVGILGATILGALTGAATGGVAGALTHAGVGKHEAEHYDRRFGEGHTIVTVRAAGREDEAHQLMRHYGAAEMTESVTEGNADGEREGRVGTAADRDSRLDEGETRDGRAVREEHVDEGAARPGHVEDTRA